MKNVFLALLVIGLTCTASRGGHEDNSEPKVAIQLQLQDDAINQVTARYIERGLQHAEEQGAECVILMLDTPGGLVNSTRDIVKSILASPTIAFPVPIDMLSMFKEHISGNGKMPKPEPSGQLYDN